MPHESEFPDVVKDTAASRRSDEAMSWLVRKDRGLSASESRALLEWIGADERNRNAWSHALECWQGMNRLSAVKSLADDTDVIVARAKKRRARRKTRHTVFALLSAAAVIALMFTEANPWRPAKNAPASSIIASSRYQVQESTARRVVLTDGSVVELNGDSRIEVEFTAKDRRVRLLSGEAHFSVAKDPEHPFLVTANGVTVRAVGTAFNVRLARDSVEVLVTEGKILLHNPDTEGAAVATVESPALVAGQRAVVDRADTKADSVSGVAIGSVGALEIDQALAWQSTRLIFDRTSLADVVMAFNRYNTRRLVLGSSELKGRSLSGVFRADNLDGLVRLLAITSDVAARENSPDEIVLLAKK